MRKSISIGLSLCLAVFMAACSQRSDTKPESSLIMSSVSEPSSQPSANNNSNIEPENDSQNDNSALIASIRDIIQQYEDGTVDTETGAPGASAPDFDKKPEDLVFPDIKSESDFQSVEPIKGHEEILMVHVKCSGDYVMQIRVNTADNYKAISTIFLG